jgi:uncharacterized protein YhaN
VADDYWDEHTDDDRISEVRDLLHQIDSTPLPDLNQIFYMTCHDELVLAVRDLLEIIDRRA